MTSSVVLFSLIVMFWGIVTSFTNETYIEDGIVEKNSSEFSTIASEAVLEENPAEKNNFEFPTLLNDSILKENPAAKNKSEFPTLENGAVFAENLDEKNNSEYHTVPVFVENLDENNSSQPAMYDDEYSGKDESFLSCDKWDYDPTEFVILPNGSAFVSSKNLTYEEPFYTVINNFLVVCIPENNKDSSGDSTNTRTHISYLSLTGVVISMVCLSIHLIVFSLVPDLQNLPGCNLASLCASLLLSYLFMLIGQDREEDGYPIICMIAGILTYFFFLASFLWMFVIAFDVCRSIVLAAGKMRITRHEFRVKKFLWYNLFSWCTSLAFTVTAVVVDNVEGVEENFRPMFRDTCWFKKKESLLLFFAVPVGFLICLNVFFFGVSAYLTFSNQMKPSLETQAHNLKNHLLYFRLTVIMGVTWITGVVAPIVNVTWLWYLFVALNTFQGLFIFLAFTCSPKVKKFIQQKLINVRRLSQAPQSPTFQSYCNYSSSNEKASDKVANSTDKPVKNGLGEVVDFKDKSLEKGLDKITDSTDKPLKNGLDIVTDFKDKSLEKGLNKVTDSAYKPLKKGIEKVTDFEDKFLEKGLDEVTNSKDKSSVKGLAKVVDSKDNSQLMEDVVIHL